jgi:hypothetical protein
MSFNKPYKYLDHKALLTDALVMPGISALAYALMFVVNYARLKVHAIYLKDIRLTSLIN